MKKHLLKSLLLCCSALGLPLYSASEIDENVYKPLSSTAFPGGCDNAFAEAKRFRDFFESSITIMASQRGADAKGVSDLFAISELSQHLLDIKPAFFEESPVDRLIKGQLCKFEEVFNAEKKPGAKSKDALDSANPLLHDHLSKIADKLFKDSYTIVEQANAERAKERSEEKLMQSRMKEVEKARRLGRDKIEALY
ncbi:MAG: hypothetical protein KA116_09490 [Proteobacteria bacterium]|nr:hypothetical protein [Pseudomonadota bacterium]